jgi:hypothetical protein
VSAPTDAKDETFSGNIDCNGGEKYLSQCSITASASESCSGSSYIGCKCGEIKQLGCRCQIKEQKEIESIVIKEDGKNNLNEASTSKSEMHDFLF